MGPGWMRIQFRKKSPQRLGRVAASGIIMSSCFESCSPFMCPYGKWVRRNVAGYGEVSSTALETKISMSCDDSWPEVAYHDHTGPFWRLIKETRVGRLANATLR